MGVYPDPDASVGNASATGCATQRSDTLFTTPTRVVEAFYHLIVENKIQHHLYVSSIEFLFGLALAIAVGLPLGLIAGRSKIIDAMVDPYVTVLNATPDLSFCHFLSFGLVSACGQRS